MNELKSEVREATLEERVITLEGKLVGIHNTLLGPTVKEQDDRENPPGVIANLFQHLNECDYLVNQIENIVDRVRNGR